MDHFWKENSQQLLPKCKLSLYNKHKQKYVDLFINFLKKNNIESQFYYNINFWYVIDTNLVRWKHLDSKDKNWFEKGTINGIIQSEYNNEKKNLIFNYLFPEFFIQHSFYWDFSKEGYSFWMYYNHQWIKQLSTFNNKIYGNR